MLRYITYHDWARGEAVTGIHAPAGLPKSERKNLETSLRSQGTC